MRRLALHTLAAIVDPNSPDYLLNGRTDQYLVAKRIHH